MPESDIPPTTPSKSVARWLDMGMLIIAVMTLPGLAACRRSVETPASPPPPKVLQVGNTVPDFAFTDQTGTARKFSESRPRAMVVNFIFTRCGVQQFCPRANRQFTELREALDATPWRDRVELLSVTLDPEHDTPDVLGPFAEFHKAQPGRWSFATMPRAELENLKGTFGVWTRPGEDGTMDHNLRTTLVDSSGRVLAAWEGNRWTNDDIFAALDGGGEKTGTPGNAVSKMP